MVKKTIKINNIKTRIIISIVVILAVAGITIFISNLDSVKMSNCLMNVAIENCGGNTDDIFYPNTNTLYDYQYSCDGRIIKEFSTFELCSCNPNFNEEECLSMK